MFRWIRSVNWTLVAAWLIVHGYLVGAAYLSFGHIIDVAHGLGAGNESWTWPFMIDGFAILGRLLMSKKLAAKTRKIGFKMLVTAGILSLVCNVMAGDAIGQKLTGLGVVLGFLVAEWAAGLLEGAPVEQAAPARPARTRTPAQRLEDARKRAGYDALSATDKANWTRRYNERIARTAPQSPAWAVKGTPSPAELDAALATA